MVIILPLPQFKILTHTHKVKRVRRTSMHTEDVLSSITREREREKSDRTRPCQALGKTHLLNSVWGGPFLFSLSLQRARSLLPLLSTLTPHFCFVSPMGIFAIISHSSAGHTWPMCHSLIPVLIPSRFYFFLSKSRIRFSHRVQGLDSSAMNAICNLDLYLIV